MSYELAFHPQALREWKKLDGTLKTQLKKKLIERLQNPHVPADRLAGHASRYKIKLRQSGYRLVYEVRDQQLIVLVLAIGKRERGQIYQQAQNRH